MRRFKSIFLLCAFLGSLAHASLLHAQSPDEIKIAREMAGDGLAAYQAGEYNKALELFEQARALYPSAQVLRMTGYSHLALQHWQKAVDTLEQSLVSEVGPLSDEDKQDVNAQLAKALAHFGTVTITSSIKGAEISIDGATPRELPLDKPLRLLEGSHYFVVSAPQHIDAEERIKLEGGKTITLTLDPKSIELPPKLKPKPKAKPKPPPPDKPKTALFQGQREVGYIAAGTGVALSGVALITSLAGASLRGNVQQDVDLHQKNFGPNCNLGDYRLCVYDRALINHDADRADTLRDISVWTAIGGAVLVAGGATLVILAPNGPFASSPAKTGSVTPRLACGPLSAGLTCSGAF